MNQKKTRAALSSLSNNKNVESNESSEGLSRERRKSLPNRRKKKQVRGTTLPPQSALDKLLGYYQSGDIVEAEKLAHSITQQFPNHPFAWKVLGLSRARLSKLKDATLACQRAVHLAPTDAEALNNLGTIFQAQDRMGDAEKAFKKAVKINPQFSDALTNLGNLHQDIGQLRRAEACYRRSLELNPRGAIAHNNLGNILRKLGDFEGSKESFSSALSLNPGDEMILMNKWKLHFDSNDLVSALRAADSCSSPLSRARAIETLFALGETKEIHKRLKIEALSKHQNLKIAAFGAFLANLEQSPNANRFCPDPINFIHRGNLSHYSKDSKSLIDQILRDLEKIETNWQPPGKSTKNGFQTARHVNLFAEPQGSLKILSEIIMKELDGFYTKYRSDRCLLIQEWPIRKKIWGWHVVLRQNGHQSAHIHDDGWISGVIYLKLPPSADGSEGAIQFSLDGEHYKHPSSPLRRILPEIGDIVLFPSSLYHQTIPFTSDSERIIVSFDLLPDSQI